MTTRMRTMTILTIALLGACSSSTAPEPTDLDELAASFACFPVAGVDQYACDGEGEANNLAENVDGEVIGQDGAGRYIVEVGLCHNAC